MKGIIRIACLGLWFAMVGSSCSPPETKPTPEDISVLSATLKHFLALATSWASVHEIPIMRRDLREILTRTMLLIDPTTLPGNKMMSDRELTEFLASSGLQLDASLLRNLRQRNGTVVSLDVLRDQCSNFLVVPTSGFRGDSSDMEDVYADANAFVRVLLPGYDRKGTSAVVQFQLGPSPHGAFAIYHLVKAGGLWQVDWYRMISFS